MTNIFKIGKKGKFLLIFPMFLFFFSLTSGATDTQQVDDVFQVNEIITYTKGCFYNGTYCSASASCNYTFYGLTNNVLINNAAATNVGSNGASIWEYNITYTDVGVYQVDMVCSDQGQSDGATFYTQITGSGLNDNFWFYGLVLVLSFGVMLLGFKLEDAPITILGTFGLYFLGLYILFNGIAGVKDLTTTWAIGIITLGVAGYISIRSAHELITG